MIIRKVRMINFRAFQDKTIDFHDKAVVLISAANGIGKTTVIDAIEWCLTGEIGRLKNAFDNRSTNDADRKKNTNGILKNRDSSKSSKTKVILWLMEGEAETVLCREQKKDELNPDVSKVTINEKETEAKAFIDQYVGKSFYNYHFCDVQKSFRVQSTKRGNLESLFSEFITNYDEQKIIAENIDLFADDVSRYIIDKEKQKVQSEIIGRLETQLTKVSEEANLIPYPCIIFYPKENVDILSLSRDELIVQKTEIENCGYIIVQNELRKLIDNDSLKSQIALIKEIRDYLINKEDSIRQALSAGLFDNSDAISSLEISLGKLNELSLTNKTILKDAETVIRYESEKRYKKDFDSKKREIQEKEKRVAELSFEIDLLTNNNRILKVFSTLSVNKGVIIEHRKSVLEEDGFARCPVCGSDAFSTMDESLILQEADEYIQRNGELVKAKENEKTDLLEEINNLYKDVTSQVKAIVEKEKEAIVTRISALRGLINELEPYLDAVKKLQTFRKDVNIEEINIERINNLQKSFESQTLSKQEEKEAENLSRKILTVLGYEYTDESIKQTYEKVESLKTKMFEITNFSYEHFVSKINAIDSVLANRSIEDIRVELEEKRRKNQKLDAEIRELDRLRNNAIQKSKSIRSIVDSLSKEEYRRIGPTLSSFYNKLVRINNHSGINVVRENDGISLVDDKEKNIVNILSNGQISVFLLAHFFAGINARNEREKMKVFFIDDLTACMDDVNMLAFIDLLKYQISSKETMEQLFFSTCDDRISRLLRYKMNGRRIEIRELVEDDFE